VVAASMALIVLIVFMELDRGATRGEPPKGNRAIASRVSEAKHPQEMALKWRLIDRASQRTYALVFETGDEVIEGLQQFAKETQATAADFTGLGALSDVVVGYFDWEKKDYQKIPVAEQVEVVSLTGNFALGENDKPALHAHIVVAMSDGHTRGGHLLKAHVRPTLEVVVTESPTHLRRKHDPESGLALIQVDEA
jgi:uncharacterized protein